MRKDLKILLVDDDPRNLRILDEIFDGLCILEHASDGEQALLKVTTFAPDLILLDGMMPGKTGLEVCRQIKANEHFCHIKIIFVTGKASCLDQEEGFNAGADGYVIKPFGEQQLLTVVEQALL